MSTCPNCNRPTAGTYRHRHDDSYCSPLTSADCWDWTATAPVHHVIDVLTDQTACGGSGNASTSRSDVTCPDCLTRT